MNHNVYHIHDDHFYHIHDDHFSEELFDNGSNKSNDSLEEFECNNANNIVNYTINKLNSYIENISLCTSITTLQNIVNNFVSEILDNDLFSRYNTFESTRLRIIEMIKTINAHKFTNCDVTNDAHAKNALNQIIIDIRRVSSKYGINDVDERIIVIDCSNDEEMAKKLYLTEPEPEPEPEPEIPKVLSKPNKIIKKKVAGRKVFSKPNKIIKEKVAGRKDKEKWLKKIKRKQLENKN